MAFNYKTPGVYVEEVASGARPIESAATAVLALIGFCRDTVLREEGPDRELKSVPTATTPTLVTNWTEFTRAYGGFDQAVPGGFLHEAAFGYFLNGGTAAYIVGLPVTVRDSNSSRPALPVSEATFIGQEGKPILRLTSTLKADDEVTVEVVAPEAGAPEGSVNLSIQRKGAEPRIITNVSMSRQRGQRNIADALPKETSNEIAAEVLDPQGTFQIGSKAILLPPKAAPLTPVATQLADFRSQILPTQVKGDAAQRTGLAGLEAIDEVTMLACPDIVAAAGAGVFTSEQVKDLQTAMTDHCDLIKDRFAILDCPTGKNVQEILAWRRNFVGDSKYSALYYPWITIANPRAKDRNDPPMIDIPPSGYIAGVYARVDAERGVHKAPANEVVRGTVGLTTNVSRNEQDLLNPEGVNCIRAFAGEGIRIWGARTLATRSDAAWRYINVRRLFSSIEKSILQNTRWIVFEPNDEFLWRQIKRDISAYLTVQWRAGALFGRVAEQAFYVKCDEETNPQEVRDLGYCIIEVGLAPVKPAEFVVFRVSQIRDGVGGTSE